MSTIGSLMLALGQSTPQPYGDIQRQTAGTRGLELGNETALLKLAELKRSQASEQEMMAAIQQDPALARLLFGDSLMGSLGQAPGGPPGGMPGAAPPPGPITQSPLGGGPAQQIPAYPDASRYAQVSPQGGGPIPPDVMAQGMPTVTPPGGAPGPVLASLGPGQGQPQGPQNPLLAMAARNPRVAMMLQQQLEGRQEAAMKRQEQQLKMGTQIMDYLGRGAQGVTDQASLDAFREETARVHPQAAASLPQTYSKEAMAPFIAKALDVKEALTLQVQDLTAQAALIKARKEGRSVDVDNQLRAMGVQPGQETPAQMKEALQAVEDAKVRVSASQGTGQIVQTPTGYVRIKPGTDQVEEIKGPGGEPLQPKASDTMERAATLGNLADKANKDATALEEKGLRPGVWEKGMDKLPLGIGNYLVSSDYQKYRQTVTEFAQAWLYKTSGAQVTKEEWERTNETYFPQPGEDKEAVENKRQKRAALVEQLRQEARGTGRMGATGQPQGQAPAASSGKPVSQMSAEETRAEIAAIKARGGR